MSGLDNSLIEALGKYIVDLPDYNHLNLGEKELDSELLEEAIRDGAMEYDLVLPLSTTEVEGKTLADFDPKLWLLIKKFAALEVLKSLVFIHIRNFNPVNDQGFTVQEFSKWKEWLSLRGELHQELAQKVSNYKRTVNIQSMNAGWTTLTHGFS